MFFSSCHHNPWKYEDLAEKMSAVVAKDECNDTYGRCRMYQALKLKYPDEDIPNEKTVYRIMEEIGLSHRPKRKPNGITKADREALMLYHNTIGMRNTVRFRPLLSFEATKNTRRTAPNPIANESSFTETVFTIMGIFAPVPEWSNARKSLIYCDFGGFNGICLCINLIHLWSMLR